jgi:hypothetical protein
MIGRMIGRMIPGVRRAAPGRGFCAGRRWPCGPLGIDAGGPGDSQRASNVGGLPYGE